jgi:HEPN domain-containing protein
LGLKVAKLGDLYKNWQRVIKRVVKEAALPTAAALAWGVTVGIKKDSIIDGVSAAGIAFFFVLSLQGQILRVAKNVRDDQDSEDFRASFASIQQAIETIKAEGLAARQSPTATAPTDEPPIWYRPSARLIPLGFDNYLGRAMEALEKGQYYAAVLVVAVGFEYAARQAADQLGISAKRASLGGLLRELGRRTEDKQAMETLHSLNMLRNSLVHAEDKEALWLSRTQALDLIDAFRAGVDALEMAA